MSPPTRIVRRDVPDLAPGYLPDRHPVLRRVFAARGVADAGELDCSLAGLAPASALAGIDAAAALLAETIDAGAPILVVGDYDADGATGCAVLVLGLRRLGARAVDFIVPDRFRFGYGLTPEIVALALERRPALIVTVDNGISSVDGVEAARAAGVRVLVTDHHLPGATLPAADAIVNPNQPGDAFPSKSLAGVGVAFYVLAALRARLRDAGRLGDGPPGDGPLVDRMGPNLAELLDLVALGTVADVVALDRNNRILVEQGLARIRAGRCRPGVRALMEVAGRSPSRAVTGDLGFAVAPRLNAAGRLTDMTVGIRCLLAEDAAEARELAARLDALNRERREIESGMRERADRILESLATESAGMPRGLCLFDPDWHPGVVGILASRVKERVHRPVIAFAPDGDGDVKGSARSVAGLHVRDALDTIAARHPGLVRRFGGHAMAAGLTLRRADLERFQAEFDAVVREHLGADDLRAVVHSDGPVEGGDLGLALARELRAAAPWGQGFPEPVFDGAFRVAEHRVVGERHLKMRLVARGAAAPLDAIAFDALDAGALVRDGAVRAAFRLDVNAWRGEERAQLVVEHLEAPGAGTEPASAG